MPDILTPPLLCKPSLYGCLTLPIVMLVLTSCTATFVKEEDMTASGSSRRPTDLLRMKQNKHDIPHATEFKRLLHTSSASITPLQEGTSSRRLLDDMKGKHARQLTGEEFTCVNPEWTQVGRDIDGDDEGDWLGSSVALSADGQILAVGAPHDYYCQGFFPTYEEGYVKVYRRDDSVPSGWKQIGQTLRGEDSGDGFGTSVALSDDGKVLAVGADSNDNDNGNASGHVRVFEWLNEVSWSQIGQDIDGDFCSTSGRSIDLSGNGEILAIGAPLQDSGTVRVYERAPSSALGWDQIGGDINGEANFDDFGKSVALSNSGDILAVGAYGNRENGCLTFFYCSGHVRVFKRDPSTDLGWVQLGGDIDGEEAGDEVGHAVALSDDGDILAFAGMTYAAVYERDESSTLGWTQVGNNIEDGTFGIYWGENVALSGDGNILAAGTPYSSNQAGLVRMFRRDPSSVLGWVQVGGNIDGESESDYFGVALALSKNGEVVAGGAYYNNGPFFNDDYYGYSGNVGHVRVFEGCDQVPISPTSSPTYTPPSEPPCASGDDKFLFEMLTDDHGEDITWKVQVKKNGNFEDYFGNGFGYGKIYADNKGFREKYCIPDDECYRFVISDRVGNGLCCENGEGGYRVTWNNGAQIELSNFENKDFEVYKFNCD